jgi:hypothetical protein
MNSRRTVNLPNLILAIVVVLCPLAGLKAPAAELRDVLASAKSEYETAVAEIEVERARQVEAATVQYLQRLEGLLNQCMDQRQLETAFAVKTEMERVRERAPVTEADLKRGLVLHFTFDKAEAGGRVTDQSGLHHDGRAVGAHWTSAGRRGGGFEFGPVSNYISVSNNDSLNPRQLTLAVWIKTVKKDSYFRRIMDKCFDDGFALSMGGDWKGETSRGQVQMEIGWASKEVCACHSGIQVADGRWHHVAATFDGITQQLYVDGAPAGKPARCKKPSDLARNSYPLTIGLDRSNPDVASGEDKASFAGSMDEVMVFDRALSAKEVRKLCDSQAAVPIAASGPAAGAAPGAQAADRLKAAKELYDQGLMTKDEYEKKVKEIINEL